MVLPGRGGGHPRGPRRERGFSEEADYDGPRRLGGSATLASHRLRPAGSGNPVHSDTCSSTAGRETARRLASIASDETKPRRLVRARPTSGRSHVGTRLWRVCRSRRRRSSRPCTSATRQALGPLGNRQNLRKVVLGMATPRNARERLTRVQIGGHQDMETEPQTSLTCRQCGQPISWNRRHGRYMHPRARRSGRLRPRRRPRRDARLVGAGPGALPGVRRAARGPQRGPLARRPGARRRSRARAAASRSPAAGVGAAAAPMACRSD